MKILAFLFCVSVLAEIHEWVAPPVARPEFDPAADSEEYYLDFDPHQSAVYEKHRKLKELEDADDGKQFARLLDLDFSLEEEEEEELEEGLTVDYSSFTKEKLTEYDLNVGVSDKEDHFEKRKLASPDLKPNVYDELLDLVSGEEESHEVVEQLDRMSDDDETILHRTVEKFAYEYDDDDGTCEDSNEQLCWTLATEQKFCFRELPTRTKSICKKTCGFCTGKWKCYDKWSNCHEKFYKADNVTKKRFCNAGYWNDYWNAWHCQNTCEVCEHHFGCLEPRFESSPNKCRVVPNFEFFMGRNIGCCPRRKLVMWPKGSPAPRNATVFVDDETDVADFLPKKWAPVNPVVCNPILKFLKLCEEKYDVDKLYYHGDRSRAVPGLWEGLKNVTILSDLLSKLKIVKEELKHLAPKDLKHKIMKK